MGFAVFRAMSGLYGAVTRDFIRSERGVVTVEWVALAAGLGLGAIAISFIVMHGLAGAAKNVASQLNPG